VQSRYERERKMEKESVLGKGEELETKRGRDINKTVCMLRMYSPTCPPEEKWIPMFMRKFFRSFSSNIHTFFYLF